MRVANRFLGEINMLNKSMYRRREKTKSWRAYRWWCVHVPVHRALARHLAQSAFMTPGWRLAECGEVRFYYLLTLALGVNGAIPAQKRSEVYGHHHRMARSWLAVHKCISGIRASMYFDHFGVYAFRRSKGNRKIASQRQNLRASCVGSLVPSSCAQQNHRAIWQSPYRRHASTHIIARH